MKKLDNFSNCLTILRNADFKLADNNDIYRTGVIGQFNLTFELAWKLFRRSCDSTGQKEQTPVHREKSCSLAISWAS